MNFRSARASKPACKEVKGERVPEAFVLDSRRTVRYRGRIDDQFGKGVMRPRATRNDLAEALDDVLAGKAVAQPVTLVLGCPISRVDPADDQRLGPLL